MSKRVSTELKKFETLEDSDELDSDVTPINSPLIFSNSPRAFSFPSQQPESQFFDDQFVRYGNRPILWYTSCMI